LARFDRNYDAQRLGIRDIERVLLVSRYSVLKTLRAAAEQVSAPSVPKRVRALELDEFRSFVGNKQQQRWTWYGFDRQRRKVVAFVNERRTDAACSELLKKLSGFQVSRYYSDDWQSYKKFRPAKRHCVGKEGTRQLERHNLNFRTHLKRLQRRTICYSKSPEMHDAVIKLYVHHPNAGHHHL
jgi:insertion element IS1 protein InsB